MDENDVENGKLINEPNGTTGKALKFFNELFE